MTAYSDLEIDLERSGRETYSVQLRLSRPDSDTYRENRDDCLRIAIDDLRQLKLDAHAYGLRLGCDFFKVPAVREVIGGPGELGESLRVRLSIEPNAEELHALRWETLIDPDAPEPSAPLFMGEKILFSRYVDSPYWGKVERQFRGDLRALVVVAGKGSRRYQLANINAAAEIERAQLGLQGVKTEVVGGNTWATLDTIIEQLRECPDILYLVCHGRLIDGQPYLYLQNRRGQLAPVAGNELLQQLQGMRRLPRLVVLVSCQSAGADKYDPASDPQGALGPALAKAGIPAVLAMHGNVFMDTIADFVPAFFRELLRDGQIDRAVAVARNQVRSRLDAWAPVLYMRLKSGSLWSDGGFPTYQGFDGWPTIMSYIDHGWCTPILGPGMTDSLVGSRPDIARRWAKIYGFPMAADQQDDLPQVAQYVFTTQGETAATLNDLQDTMRSMVLKELGTPESENGKSEPVQDLLIRLAERRWASDSDEPHLVLANTPSKMFVTTAIDPLLTAALVKVGKDPQVEYFRWTDETSGVKWPRSVFDAKRQYEPSIERPLVYHLFGRLDIEGSLVIKEDDYFKFLVRYTNSRAAVPTAVRATLASSALLFLGFNLNSWDFRVLIWSVMNNSGKLGSIIKKYAHVGVQIDLDESQIIELERARRYLESYLLGSNIRIFWGSAADFTRELRKQRTNSP